MRRYLVPLMWLCVPLSLEALTPTLSIPQAIPARFGVPVEVPVTFAGSWASISSVVFSLDFDESCLGFDPADGDVDGIPDAIVFSVPGSFTPSVSYDGGDTDGELDFVIADFYPPLATLPDGVVATVTFTPLCDPEGASIIAPVLFSDDPSASFGDSAGQGVPGMSFDGWIEISDHIFSDGFESGGTTQWSAAAP